MSIVFTQIIDVGGALHGLDDHGHVWRFQAHTKFVGSAGMISVPEKGYWIKLPEDTFEDYVVKRRDEREVEKAAKATPVPEGSPFR